MSLKSSDFYAKKFAEFKKKKRIYFQGVAHERNYEF